MDWDAFQQKFVQFACEELKDLKLWKRLLAKAAIGILMNLIVIRCPPCIFWSDACPFGIGVTASTAGPSGSGYWRQAPPCSRAPRSTTFWSS
jgi:hypothetical protein